MLKQQLTAYLGIMPMRPHLFTFLQNKEHLDEHEPLPLFRDSLTAMYLNSLLLTKTAIRDDERDVVPAGYTARLYFDAPADKKEKLHLFLTPSRIIRFNSFVNQYLHETLFDLVDNFTEEGVKEKEVIYLFINRFRLYEINFDTLKKACTRRRERLGLPLLRARRERLFVE